MVCADDIANTLSKMILSASGWRGIFASDGDEESKSAEISEAHKLISACAACVFSEYLSAGDQEPGNALVLLGSDTRPTGKAIIESMIPVLLRRGCTVKYAGILAAPEIMAWARSQNHGSESGDPGKKNNVKKAGFIYISASHNPIGHNGIKFGLTDGGVLPAEEAEKLICNFRNFIKNDDNTAGINSLLTDRNNMNAENSPEAQVRGGSWSANIKSFKSECFNAYYNFCNEVVWGGNDSIAGAVKDSLKKKPLGIVCDFNGSARTVSVDRDFFSALGIKFECINGEPGHIAHRIVPEGESLGPCCKFLEETQKRDKSFVLGYVPDCDGDRGNLVIFDETAGRARALEAQEVFALACVAELSHLVWTGSLLPGGLSSGSLKAAIAVNDPTSMRIDRIAECFGVSVFRAEVGEANVVSLARKLRENGFTVRILGEGSAGGNITHPSAVRDPINTVLAIAKMLTVRSQVMDEKSAAADNMSGRRKKGLFEIWCGLSGQIDKYKDDFSITDIIAGMPRFITTPAYSKDAVMRIKTQDHAALKERYQRIFLRDWETLKRELRLRFGFYRWEAAAYNGTEEKRRLTNFAEAGTQGRGGLKILFFDANEKETAYIWMRASATEPVFRIMADAEGTSADIERYLLDWQRKMIMEADSGGEQEA